MPAIGPLRSARCDMTGTLANSVPVLPDRLGDIGTQCAREKKDSLERAQPLTDG